MSPAASIVKLNMKTPTHSENFQSAAKLYRRGGPQAACCGARLRNGASCPNPPIPEGKGRCLSHTGPHAARAFRERQKRRFESGGISAEEWNRAEARRAANRLGDKWKNNPWVLGSTIDLAEHELAFRNALGGIEVQNLAPAVADWLRWRFRRTQIDSCNETAWVKALTIDLPVRNAKAGEPPIGTSDQGTAGFRRYMFHRLRFRSRSLLGQRGSQTGRPTAL